MKKLFTLILLLLSCPLLQAEMFGLTEKFVQYPDKYWLLRKIVAGQPVKYVIHIDENNRVSSAESNETALLQEKMTAQRAIVMAVNSWFAYTNETIEKSPHKEDFKDILSIVSRPIRTEVISDEKSADLIVTFTSLEEIQKHLDDPDALGYANGLERTVSIPYLQYGEIYEGDRTAQSVLKHEIGHILGLSDQYENADNASPTYSTSHRIDPDYGEEAESLSIMGNKYSFDCDDADAVVYAIDYLLNYGKQPSEYSARVKAGWKSFCGDGTTIQNLKVLNKRPYFSDDKLYRYYREGDIKEVLPLNPFLFRGRDLKYVKQASDEGDFYYFGHLADDRNNLFTSYFLALEGFENPTLIAVVGPSEADPTKHIKATRVTDPAGDYWKIPYNLAQPIQVYPKKTMCSELTWDTPVDYFEYAWVDIYPDRPAKLVEHVIAQFKGAPYHGPQKEIFGKLQKEVLILGGETKDQPGIWKCRLGYVGGPDDELLFENGKLISSNEPEVQRLAQEAGVSVAQFQSAVLDVCSGDRIMVSLDVIERRSLCSFVLELEDYYQQLKAKQK